MLALDKKDALHKLHEKILAALQADCNRGIDGEPIGVCRPLFIYALDENYLPQWAVDEIKKNLDDILAWGKEFYNCRKRDEGFSTIELMKFPLVLILFHVLCFYQHADGRNRWKCIRKDVEAKSSFGLILDNDSGLGERKKNKFLPDITNQYGISRDDKPGLILNNKILKALGCHDDQLPGEESYNYEEFFRYNCPFLSVEERGNNAERLKANERVYDYLLGTSFGSSWLEVCEQANLCALEEECRALANEIIDQELDDKAPDDDKGKLCAIISKSSYIHALLKFAPMEYFLSLKALCSETAAEGASEAQEKWPWLKALWNRSKISARFTWQLAHTENGLDFQLFSSLENSVRFKQGNIIKDYYRPQIDREDLKRVGFDMNSEIEVYSLSGNNQIGSIAPLPARGAYLLPEHRGKIKAGFDLRETDNLHPALFRKRLYLISRGDIETLFSEDGTELRDQKGERCHLDGYQVKMYILDTPTQSSSMKLHWGGDELFIHMPARPEIPESNGFSDIVSCRYKGRPVAYCIQMVSVDDIEESLQHPNDNMCLPQILTEKEGKLPFMSYMARLGGDRRETNGYVVETQRVTVAALVSGEEECIEECRSYDIDRNARKRLNIFGRNDGYLIEKVENGKKSTEHYFVSRKLPNYVTVKCELKIQETSSLDREQSCLLLPHDWRKVATPADVLARYTAAQALNDSYQLEIKNEKRESIVFSLEIPLKKQVGFVLHHRVTPVEKASNSTAHLDELSLEVFPSDSETEKLNIKKSTVKLRFCGRESIISPRPGMTLLDIFSTNNVPFDEHCELLLDEQILFSGEFIPRKCCISDGSIYLPEPLRETYTLRLRHESAILDEKEKCVSASEIREISELVLHGRKISGQNLIGKFFDGTRTGWYRLCLETAPDIGVNLFRGKRSLSEQIIRDYRRHSDDYEDWPELVKEIKELSQPAIEQCEPEPLPEHSVSVRYPRYVEFVRSFENTGWGYIDSEGDFSRDSKKQIPIRRFFRIEGENEEPLSEPKYIQNGHYFKYRRNKKYCFNGQVIQRDFVFAQNKFKTWYERDIQNNETLYPIVERWLTVAQKKLDKLNYQDIKDLGRVVAPQAVWLRDNKNDIFDGGYSLVFQISKHLYTQNKIPAASLMLLSIYLIMKDKGMTSTNNSLNTRLGTLENQISDAERVAVSKCMNLIHWLLIHF